MKTWKNIPLEPIIVFIIVIIGFIIIVFNSPAQGIVNKMVVFFSLAFIALLILLIRRRKR